MAVWMKLPQQLAELVRANCERTFLPGAFSFKLILPSAIRINEHIPPQASHLQAIDLLWVTSAEHYQTGESERAEHGSELRFFGTSASGHTQPFVRRQLRTAAIAAFALKSRLIAFHPTPAVQPAPIAAAHIAQP